jgi:hypothetical protein
MRAVLKMKLRIREIIIFGVVLLVLVGVVVLLKVIGGGDGEENGSVAPDAPESRLLYDKNPADIISLTVTNETGEYLVERAEEGDLLFWFIGEFTGVPVDFEKTAELVEAAASMTSRQLVDDDAPDLSLYGLSNPRAAVKVEFSDAANTVKELCVGNDTPLIGKTYFCFSGENAVYTVNTVDVSIFLNDKYDYVQRTVYKTPSPPDPDDGADYGKINKIAIGRKNLDYNIVIEYDKRADDPDIITGNSSSYVLTSPVRLDLSPDKSYDVLNMVFGLTATGIEILNPTAEQLEEYGFNDAEAYVAMDITGGGFEMLIGKQNDEKTGRYAYVKGIDIIYYFDDSELPWATVMPLDLTVSMITSNYIFSVNSLTLSGSGADARYTLTGSDDDDFIVKRDGLTVDAKAFKTFYQFILKAPPEELFFETVGQEPDLTITIAAENNTDTLEFVRLENRRCAVILNGQPSFSCKAAYLDRLIQNLRLFENGEKIIETW